jgi:hypothetical protein
MLPSYILACSMARILERWLGKSAQSDKWKFCLSATRIPHVGRAHDEANPPQPRGSAYYIPRPVSVADLAIMRWID